MIKKLISNHQNCNSSKVKVKDMLLLVQNAATFIPASWAVKSINYLNNTNMGIMR